MRHWPTLFHDSPSGMEPGWATENCLRFNLIGSAYPVTALRAVQPSEPTGQDSDSVELILIGNVERSNMADTSVRYFDSTMSGAPAIGDSQSASLAYWTHVSLTGLVRLRSLAWSSLVTSRPERSAGAWLFDDGSAVGSVITIAYATPSYLNGTWRIASVADSTHFTFITSGISDQTAT